MQVVILAGGLATRLGKITEHTPKSMIEIAGKPFIHWQLKKLEQKGVKKVVLCVRHHSEKIRQYVKDGSKFGLEVEYSDDGEQALGTGGAIKKALNMLDDTFLILYGDSYLDVNYFKVLNSLNEQHLGLMTLYKNNNKLEPSNVILKDNQITLYHKKNKVPEMEYIDYGLGVFRKEAFKIFYKDCFDLSEVYEYLVNAKRLSNCIIGKRFYEIGSVKGIEETEKYILKNRRR